MVVTTLRQRILIQVRAGMRPVYNVARDGESRCHRYSWASPAIRTPRQGNDLLQPNWPFGTVHKDLMPQHLVPCHVAKAWHGLTQHEKRSTVRVGWNDLQCCNVWCDHYFGDPNQTFYRLIS